MEIEVTKNFKYLENQKNKEKEERNIKEEEENKALDEKAEKIKREELENQKNKEKEEKKIKEEEENKALNEKTEKIKREELENQKNKEKKVTEEIKQPNRPSVGIDESSILGETPKKTEEKIETKEKKSPVLLPLLQQKIPVRKAVKREFKDL